MVKAVLFDFSRVLLFPLDDKYTGSLNSLYKLHVNDNDFGVFKLFKLNFDLINYIETKLSKLRFHILTSETIQEDPEIIKYLKPIFKNVYSASQIGIKKNDPAIFEYVSKDLHLDPSEILFIDDSEENIKAAKISELITIRYQTNTQLIGEMDKLSTE
jgi:HAD superfamily hydrolase (TIGR01549 family)